MAVRSRPTARSLTADHFAAFALHPPELLADNERLALQRGSIFGRNFWEGGLEALGTPDCAPTLTQLQPAASSSCNQNQRWPVSENGVSITTCCAKPLTKASSNAIGASLHKEAAAWLEKQARQAGRLDEFVGILAEHAERAGQVAAAANWYLRAGTRAQAQGCFSGSTRFVSNMLWN